MNTPISQPLSISKAISNTMILMALVAFFMQIPIDDTSDNIASACLALIGSMCALLYFRNTDAIQTHPFSTFAIFGFCAMTQYGALLVQSFTWHSLSHDLRQPTDTFAILMFYLMVAIAAHMTYRYFSPEQNGPRSAGAGVPKTSLLSLRGALDKLQLYAIPSVQQLWIIGFIGLVAILVAGTSTSADQNIIKRISAGFSFMTWAPFMIPVCLGVVGPRYCNRRLNYLMLTGFACLIGLIGVAANARFMIVAGATTTALIALLMGMRSSSPASGKRIFQAIVLVTVCGAMLIPVSQLALAMVVVRENHRSISPITMINSTVDVMMSEKSVDNVRNRDKFAAFSKPYDEYYVDNPILARFVITKFHDNALYFESRISDQGKEELAETTEELFWSILPDPVLKEFDIKVNKKQLQFSMGDYLLYQVTGNKLGGYKLGSIFAHGIGLFGMLFPLVYFVICLVSFWMIELLTNKSQRNGMLISAVGTLLVWRLFQYGVTSESVNDTVGFLFREIPQSILMYILAYHLSRFAVWPFLALGKLNTGSGKVVAH